MNSELVVQASNVKFAYDTEESINYVLKDVSLNITKGSYVALLGRNGSGKSTFAKLADALELPNEGTIKVFGIVSSDEIKFWDIRKKTGCVFQNPDNQIVGTTVEEDVAFGPENLGIPNPELRSRVDAALKYVGLYELRDRQTASLSGGQKQKLAIAGILAMKPEFLILDEATAMLDPISRNDLLELVEKLISEEHLTVLTITHDMSEAMRTDYVYIMDKGRIVMSGIPGEVLSDAKKMNELGLEAHLPARFVSELEEISGIPSKEGDKFSIKSSLEYIRNNFKVNSISKEHSVKEFGPKVFSVENLSYHYEKNKSAIENINLEVKRGELLAIVGRSGCGKTTLISHFNGIFTPEGDGNVMFYDDEKTYTTRIKKDISKIRQKVGLVFQYPEYQLFEETVYKDISYGPMKMGMEEDYIKKHVMDALDAVGLDSSILDKSPFEISGGQQRRVAMAGVIAMNPDVLVLDEPAAGLDPNGRLEIFSMIANLKKRGKTIILVTHNMDEAYAYADRICVINNGRIRTTDNAQDLFISKDLLREMEIDQPILMTYLDKVAEALDLDSNSRDNLLLARTVHEACELLVRGSKC